MWLVFYWILLLLLNIFNDKYKAKKRNAIGVPFSFDKKSNYLAADAEASAT